jgi:thiol-disulfide isomerase/thioredoxin
MKQPASRRYSLTPTVIFILSGLIGGHAFSQNIVFHDPDAHPLIGRISPQIEGTTLNGTSFDLAGHRGKIVVVNFWSFTCSGCYKEIVELNIIADKYRDKDVMIISLMADSRIKALSRISKSGSFYKLNKPVANNSDINFEIIPDAGGTASAFKVEGYPMTFVIDKKGFVRGFSYGYRASYYNNGTAENSENFKVLTQKIEQALKAN